MTAGRPRSKPRSGWFIGVQAYGPNGGPTWVVRGPFENKDSLDRACAELRAINKVMTEPYQAISLRQAREMCSTQKVAGKLSKGSVLRSSF